MDSNETATEAEMAEELAAGVVADLVQVPVPVVKPADAAEMAGLPVEDWDYQQPRRGQIRPGVILAIGEQEIIVGLDAKRDGVVPFADMQRMGPEALAQIAVGDKVDVFVLQPEDQDGNLVVSLYQARQSQSWKRAEELNESGGSWEAEVVGYNKGGLVIPVGDIRGFVPASQIPGFPQGLAQEERIRRLSEMVGETMRVKAIEINRRNRRLILSAVAADREWREQQREQLLEHLREGEVRRGVVSSLCSFGAFVDLGGAEGLVHLSELSWQRVRHPKEVVNVGDEVEVYVLRLDHENKRIGLSLKRLQPEPWALVEDKYELGQLVEGVISNVVDFGAFAQIEEGVEGLIHVSELTDQPITHPREVVRRGDLLLLRIIRIDLRRKRLGLSLKRVLESEWAEWAARRALDEQRATKARAIQVRERREPVPEPPIMEREPEPEPPIAEPEPPIMEQEPEPEPLIAEPEPEPPIEEPEPEPPIAEPEPEPPIAEPEPEPPIAEPEPEPPIAEPEPEPPIAEPEPEPPIAEPEPAELPEAAQVLEDVSMLEEETS